MIVSHSVTRSILRSITRKEPRPTGRPKPFKFFCVPLDESLQKKNERPRRSALSAFELRFPIKWIVPVAARRIFQEVQLSVRRFPEPGTLLFFLSTAWSNGRLDREARGNDDGQNVAISRLEAPLTRKRRREIGKLFRTGEKKKKENRRKIRSRSP